MLKYYSLTRYCISHVVTLTMSFPGGTSGKEHPCQFRRHKKHEFNPWAGKISLKEGMATHYSILAWRIPWTEELTGYSP